MNEAPVTPPPSDAAAQLAAARQAGAHHYIKTADQLAAAGHAIPYAHRRDVEQVRAAVARSRQAYGPLDEAMLRGGVNPADARSAVLANRLLNAGADPERVAEAMGNRENWRDDRTPAQIEHDRRHGITPVVNANSYFAPLPPDVDLPPAGAQQLDAHARDLASSLGMSPAAGSSFIKTVYAAGAELDRAPDSQQLKQQWEQQLAAVYGPKLAEATKQVDDLLNEFAADSELGKRLKQYGAIRNPMVFTALRNRAQTLAAWRAGRPD